MRRHVKAPSVIDASAGTSRAGKTLFGMACLCVLGLAAFLGTGAPSAGAASGCGAGPCVGADGDRGYELISSAPKNSAPVGQVAFSPDGEFATFVQKPGADPEFALSRRESLPGGLGRWHVTDRFPPRSQLAGEGNYIPVAVTPDRTKIIYGAQKGIPLTAIPEQAIARVDIAGQQDILTVFPPNLSIGTNDAVVSDDGEHVFMNVVQNFDPEHAPFSSFNVYDVGVDPPLLISRLPDGSVPVCGATSHGFATGSLGGMGRHHWNSIDGTRVFFLTAGSGSCGEPPQLYRREISTSTTTLISGPAASGPDAKATLLRASSDGSSVVFLTAANLVAGDTNGNPDIYRWTEASGNACLSCVVPDPSIDFLAGVPALSIGVSEDLSRVYFASSDDGLAPGATPGALNIYLLKGGTIAAVAPTSGNTELIDNPKLASTMTDDGTVLIFRANAPELDSITGSSNGGKYQYYRYDDATGVVACVSCPDDGPATIDVTRFLVSSDIGTLHAGSVLSGDGSRFVFRTEEALVPRDVNGGLDIYEWHDGELGLITDGVLNGTNFGNLALIGITADGRDVFFVSYAALAPTAFDSGAQLYDARIGGGEPPPPAVLGSCDGDACQGSPSLPPAPASAGSSAFSGAGNVRQSRGKRCGRNARRVRRGGKVRCVKQKHLKKRAAKHNREAGR